MNPRDRYLMVLGSIESLSRLYNGMVKIGESRLAKLIRDVIDEYIGLLGEYAERVIVEEHIELDLPGDHIDVKALFKHYMFSPRQSIRQI